MKEVIVAVAASLGTAVILWLVGIIGKIPDIVSVPKGAVVAFDSESCPVEGWKEFKAAHGRFIRGVDKSGSNIDPDGERKPGSLQDDVFKSHKHDYTHTGGFGHRTGEPKFEFNGSGGGPSYSKTETGEATGSGSETRPKNVALLYCIKL